MRQTIRPTAVSVLSALLMAVMAVLWAGALPAEVSNCENETGQALEDCCRDGGCPAGSPCDQTEACGAGLAEIDKIDTSIAVVHNSLVRYIEADLDEGIIAKTQKTLAMLEGMRADLVGSIACNLKQPEPKRKHRTD